MRMADVNDVMHVSWGKATTASFLVDFAAEAPSLSNSTHWLIHHRNGKMVSERGNGIGEWCVCHGNLEDPSKIHDRWSIWLKRLNCEDSPFCGIMPARSWQKHLSFEQLRLHNARKNQMNVKQMPLSWSRCRSSTRESVKIMSWQCQLRIHRSHITFNRETIENCPSPPNTRKNRGENRDTAREGVWRSGRQVHSWKSLKSKNFWVSSASKKDSRCNRDVIKTSLAASGILLAGPGVGAPPHLMREAAAKSEMARKSLETSAPPPSGPNHPNPQHWQLLQRCHLEETLRAKSGRCHWHCQLWNCLFHARPWPKRRARARGGVTLSPALLLGQYSSCPTGWRRRNNPLAKTVHRRMNISRTGGYGAFFDFDGKSMLSTICPMCPIIEKLWKAWLISSEGKDVGDWSLGLHAHLIHVDPRQLGPNH